MSTISLDIIYIYYSHSTKKKYYSSFRPFYLLTYKIMIYEQHYYYILTIFLLKNINIYFFYQFETHNFFFSLCPLTLMFTSST